DGIHDLEVGVHDDLERGLRTGGRRALGETPQQGHGEARGGDTTNGRHGLLLERIPGDGTNAGGWSAPSIHLPMGMRKSHSAPPCQRAGAIIPLTCAPIARPEEARDVHPHRPGALTRSSEVRTSSGAFGWPTAPPSPTGSGSPAPRAVSSPSSTAWPAT